MHQGEVVPGRAGVRGVSGSPNNQLQHRYENRSPVVECKHYLQDEGVNFGCYFSQREIIQFQPFHVLVNASLGGRTLEIPSERTELQDRGMEWWGAPPLPRAAPSCPGWQWGHQGTGTTFIGYHLCLPVKPYAPVNLTIHNMSSNQLQLTWTSPYPRAQCLEHAVKYKSNKDTSWTVRAPRTWQPCDCACGTSRAQASVPVLALIAWPTSLCRST